MNPLVNTRRVAALAAAVTLGLGGLAGCAKEDTGGTTEGGVTLVKAGALTTCTHLPYAPFQAKDDTGKVVGFDVALVDLVAKKLGVTQEIIDTPFEGIKSGSDLNAGKCDIAAAGMTITDERKVVLDFSDPYFDATQALAVLTGSSVKTLEELAGKRVGVQGGTTGEAYINAQVAEKSLDIEVVSYKDLAAQQQALATNQVEAAVNDLPVWNEYIKTNPGKVVVATGFDTGEQYGFAVKKGNAELLKAVNESLAAARTDGTYDQIYATWIGAKPAA
ncbi:polar amino acid transport system substrate-binding protein [Catenuloplanes nepalensis]|uniref:Polar amino acid transport system substrate-binding protein n=1 Tax=Catenuloplanes nepalensis TaxID=587533 RepID=A0ABT9MV07_9ACTN|nr:basic amino acid ABC transporter substrate-binding protein [Catenuloplanes nepalensis]MDP9795063.1 polar amino acid transport system substrate-binding protein [Catenuloplanes nepalensis]